MSQVRTRFAPSPTGFLHLGSARTALFNWAFARHHGGVFVLRIEDTDRERSTAESEAGVIEGLRWLGLDWDEGPYRQSERAARHAEVIEQLLAEGHAYRCVCSRQDLEVRKQATLNAGGKWTYDGRCRDAQLGPDCGDHTVRLRLPSEGLLGFRDLVFGASGQDASEIGDKIIRRSDGGVLFHLAVVVDDIDMQISHVIRGADHMPNTPFHIALYRALEATPPAFAHVPLILAASGKKLSKRRDPVSIQRFRDEGIVADALRNWIVRLGWSHGDQEIFSVDDMQQLFDIADVNQSASAFNPEKLRWVNQQHIIGSPAEKLGTLLVPFLEHAGINVSNGPDPVAVAEGFRERAETLADMAASARYCYEDFDEIEPGAAKKHLRPVIERPLAAARDALAELGDWTKEAIQEQISETASQFNIGLGKLGQPIRVAVTGGPVSPPIDVTLWLVGRKRTIERLDCALEQIRERAAAVD